MFTLAQAQTEGDIRDEKMDEQPIDLYHVSKGAFRDLLLIIYPQYDSAPSQLLQMC